MKKFLLLLLLIPHIAYAQLPNYCSRLQLPGWWGSAEYLSVWRKARYYPSLAEHVGNSPVSGARFDGGVWLTRCIGFGGTWTVYGKEHVVKPLYHASNNIWVADLYTRFHMRCFDYTCFSVDVLAGFRYSRLTDSVHLTTTDILSSTTENDFYSGLLGVIGACRFGRWAAQVTGKVGIGNMVQRVHGFQVVRPLNNSDTTFEITGEVDGQLAFYVWRHMMLTAGYQAIYWPKVFLADEGTHQKFWAQGPTAGIYFLY